MTLNDNTLWDYEQVARRLGQFKDAEKTIPDVDTIKRLVREGRIKSLPMSDRRIMFDPQAIEDYINGLKGEPVTPQVDGKSNGSNPADEVGDKQKKIDLIAKDKELYIKDLEFETYKAGFPTLEEYKKSVDEFMKDKEAFGLEIKELIEREHAVEVVETNLYAREQALQKRLEGIEAERNEILTEAHNQADELLARTKVEVKKQEISEDEDIKWAFNEFYKIIYAMNEWDFSDYSQSLRGRLEFIIDNFNNSDCTLKDLSGDFRYCSNIVNNLMEYTQTMKKGAHQFVELRNELGGILKGIQIRLHLDDERRVSKNLPALPSD